jgi:hypothetical protein
MINYSKIFKDNGIDSMEILRGLFLYYIEIKQK